MMHDEPSSGHHMGYRLPLRHVTRLTGAGTSGPVGSSERLWRCPSISEMALAQRHYYRQSWRFSKEGLKRQNVDVPSARSPSCRPRVSLRPTQQAPELH
jgi:hypothetical protein